MIVTLANVQDRAAAPELLASLGSVFPCGCTLSLPDAGFAGDKLKAALKNIGDWTIES